MTRFLNEKIIVTKMAIMLMATMSVMLSIVKDAISVDETTHKIMLGYHSLDTLTLSNVSQIS